MKKIGLIAIIIALFSTMNFAQKEQTLFKDSGIHTTGGWGGMTFGYTPFPKDYAITTGGFGGIGFNNKFFVGWGGERMKSKIEIQLDSLTYDISKYNHNGFLLEYMTRPNKVFYPKIGIVMGGGSFDFKIQDAGDNTSTSTSKFVLLQPAAGIEINVFRWLHLGIDVGYKAIFIKKSELKKENYPFEDNNLSRPFAALKLKFGWSWK